MDMNAMNINLLDVVALLEDYPQNRLAVGSIGTVVEVLDDHTFLVEFAYTNGESFAFLPLSQKQLMKLHHEPVEMA